MTRKRMFTLPCGFYSKELKKCFMQGIYHTDDFNEIKIIEEYLKPKISFKEKIRLEILEQNKIKFEDSAYPKKVISFPENELQEMKYWDLHALAKKNGFEFKRKIKKVELIELLSEKVVTIEERLEEDVENMLAALKN